MAEDIPSLWKFIKERNSIKTFKGRNKFIIKITVKK